MMRRLLRSGHATGLLCVPLFLLSAPSALAASVATAQTDAPAPSETQTLGREIASLLNSETVTLAQANKMFAETIPTVFAADPGFAELEQQYPGLTRHLIDAMQPVIERQTVATLPDLWDRMGAVYAETLTATELRQALAFYKSETGGWLISQIAIGSDFTSVIQRLAKDETGLITAEDLKASVQDSAVGSIAKGMTAARTKDILDFVQTPAGLKIRALSPRLLEVAATWSNESNPAEEAELEALVEQVVNDFIMTEEAATSDQDAS